MIRLGRFGVRTGTGLLSTGRRHSVSLTEPARQAGTGLTSSPIPVSLASGTGIIAGALGATAGIGGGVCILPILRRTTSMKAAQISATSLLAVGLGALTGSAQFASSGVLDMETAVIAGLVTLGSVSGVMIGSKLCSLVSGSALLRAVAVCQLLAIPFVLNASPVESPSSSPTSSPTSSSPSPTPLALDPTMPLASFNQLLEFAQSSFTMQVAPLVGLLGGVVSGLVGAGGGLAMVACLSTIMPQEKAIAVSIATMLPTAVFGSTLNYMKGTLAVRSSVFLALGCSLGMGLTSRFVTPNLEEQHLRWIFVGVLAASGTALLLG